MKSVIAFANHVLDKGRDSYRDKPTPLFADGINVFTSEHLEWKSVDQEAAVISNLACQQNLFRTLTGLSILTGDPIYKEAAKAAIQYHFDYLADPSGLLQWGGHRFIDLKNLLSSGPGDKNMVHELKNTFPYYELMAEVDAQKTKGFIEGFWNAHIYDWEALSMGRHGDYGLEVKCIWDHERVELPVFRETKGLSFLNTGNDLIYSGGFLYHFNQEPKVLDWTLHLAKQYIKARHTETGLGVYQFTQPLKRGSTHDDSNTNSMFGDRAKRQFGPELGDIALEANALFATASTIYCENALIQMHLADLLGDEGASFLEWTIEGLLSFAKYAYEPSSNEIKPMFTDGKDLTGFVLKRDGYYGKKGQILERKQADGKYLLSYCRAYLYTQDESLWAVVRAMGRGLGLGDLGSKPGELMKLNLKLKCHDARVLCALLDIYQATGINTYLEIAKQVGENIEKMYFHHGFFTKGARHVYASFDAIQPLALVLLEAAIRGKYDLMPQFLDGKGFIHGSYHFLENGIMTITDGYLYDHITLD